MGAVKRVRNPMATGLQQQEDQSHRKWCDGWFYHGIFGSCHWAAHGVVFETDLEVE